MWSDSWELEATRSRVGGERIKTDDGLISTTNADILVEIYTAGFDIPRYAEPASATPCTRVLGLSGADVRSPSDRVGC